MPSLSLNEYSSRLLCALWDAFTKKLDDTKNIVASVWKRVTGFLGGSTGGHRCVAGGRGKKGMEWSHDLCRVRAYTINVNVSTPMPKTHTH